MMPDRANEAAQDADYLLRMLTEVEAWVKEGDPKAKPFLDADAVRLINGKVSFYPARFDAVIACMRKA